MTRPVLSVLVLLAMASPAVADPVAADADAWCEANPHVLLIRDADGLWHRVEDDLPSAHELDTFSEKWRGSLDADDREDLVLSELVQLCGAHECMLQAYVSCADGTYSLVGGGYGDKVRVKHRKRSTRGWATLRLRNVGETDSNPRYSWGTYRFGADGYR